MSYVGTCATCGKLCYPTKTDAKRAIRGHKHRDGRLSAYRCGDYWHLGHLPYQVARGVLARDAITPRRRDTA